MKRLFALRDNKGRLLSVANGGPAHYWESKKEAKENRDRLFQTGDEYFVTPGPDHHNYKG